MLYLVSSILYCVSNFRGGEFVFESVKLLLCGYSVYYFVALIIQYYVLLPFLKPLRIKGLLVTALISGISILCICYFSGIQGYKIPLLIYAGPFPVWMVFFCLGIYLSSIQREYALKWLMVLIVCCLVWQYRETLFLMDFHGKGLGIKLSSFVYSFVLICFLFSKKVEDWYNEYCSSLMKPIVYLGSISYGIYLSHCYVISLLSTCTPGMDWLFKWLLVLLVDVCMIALGRKLFPSITKKYLGFG